MILLPFRWLIGLSCLVLTGLIFSSLFISAFDRIINSDCGIYCGFFLEKPTFLNPIDWILVYASSYFPFDYLAFLCLVTYIFISSLYGIIRLGIKIFCFTIYDIRKGSTMPQALLIMAFVISQILMVVVT